LSLNGNVLGIDIGSVAVAVVELSPGKSIVKKAYCFHQGDFIGQTKKLLRQFNISGIQAVVTTSSTSHVISACRQYDDRICLIAAFRHFHGHGGGTILHIGGERYGAIFFDRAGNYRHFASNSACAAGTGSFLDQQALRLGLKRIEDLAVLAEKNRNATPAIATRCAVFAKTDLAHAQQEGYSLEEICDGICQGLAKNIVDSVFKRRRPQSPILLSGGVSRNKSVVKHIKLLLKEEVQADDLSPYYSAIGAVLSLLDEPEMPARQDIRSVDDLFLFTKRRSLRLHDPLKLELSDYPNFESARRYEYPLGDANPVEVDIYKEILENVTAAYLGIDIGSTSTKAVLMNSVKSVLAGFYTRTAGRPVEAMQKIFSAIDDMSQRGRFVLKFHGAGTTGSGRKLSGRLIRADLIVDEITAHARAALELLPGVDTIIEIGGQDSKFTTLKDGMVDFCVLNNVCAAGTGSFIEEQARKLDCPLDEIAKKAIGQRSPEISDRCTVFMEKDINHCLSEGYSVNEMLGSVLHSVRENYLTKVASEGRIGDRICFQGATAKNKALVAAFEQRLKKPIHVSRYCHLTGALGMALILLDRETKKSRFRGIGIHKREIPLHSEVCGLCTNCCKLTVADIDGERIAYGFLCGRDYGTPQYVGNNRSGFELLRERKIAASASAPAEFAQAITVGIPAALHLQEDLDFWKHFFSSLHIKTVTSEGFRYGMTEGNAAAGAEFCSPLIALYGHVKHLLERCDYVFLPFYFERKKKSARQQYCYYTQFASALASFAGEEHRFLMPVLHYLYSNLHTRRELYRMLRPITGERPSFLDVSNAYQRARSYKRDVSVRLRELYRKHADHEEIHVVFLGRPYILSGEAQDKKIPEIFGSLGVKTFYQDMLSYGEEDIQPIGPLLKNLHWHYGSKVLEAAEVVAKSESAYPVFLTAFKCTPDSMVIEYFRKIMEGHQKPYLILQLDDHRSTNGYETRIESALQSFRNHFASQNKPGKPHSRPSSLQMEKQTCLEGKTLLLPNWDAISSSLILASLKGAGIDARLLKESQSAIRESLRFNTGQCLPLSIMVQEFIECIERDGLDPARTVLWVAEGEIACNLKPLPHYIKHLLDCYGKGMEKASVYAGSLSMAEISLALPRNIYFSYMFGGLLRKIGCRMRPYEKNRGATDAAIKKSLDILSAAFRGDRTKGDALADALSLFESVDITCCNGRPKVAIFGDLYARDNDILNQDLIPFIEHHGGEVITTPYSSYIKMIAGVYLRKWFFEGHYMGTLTSWALMKLIRKEEMAYMKYFEKILKEAEPDYDVPSGQILSKCRLRVEHTGESMDNILKLFYLIRQYPDICLFVQASPSFCCPSLVTEAMSKKLEEITGVPIVSISYDGLGGRKNDSLIPYLKYPAKTSERPVLADLHVAISK